jgi:ABC-type antimicrobial peptide transport system permease subunit
MTLLALFGVVALALAAVGIYGVLAFAVTERAREFGIRQALGADRATILSLVLGQGLRTAGTGIVLGLAGCFAVTRHLQSMLYGVERYDLGVVGAVAALLFTVALCACYVPARSATRVDPIAALRRD